MPQITKIRIVNFRYNNSNRLIADELFDLTDTKNNAVNTLFSMENGTGKTILVHLMLQPIIPMAKVSGRNIRDSFIKAADHSFIMLEMTKDYSDEKLMIGIAISASNASINDDDTRGKSVKYYTFYSEYKEKSNFDIQSLPLSRKENGSIAFESFDGFRKYINSNKGNIHYYHSDDSYEWRQKLEEFGIYETEWRTIEKLNSEEDGLGKYFDNFKSSTAIIDKLLIKTIEEKIEHGRTDEDSSLTSILLAYVNQYDKNKENIKEKDALDSFVEELKDVSNNTEQLLSLADEIHKRIGELFTFLDLMYSEKRDAEEEIENLQHQQEKIQETIQDIKWEKASKEYYLAEDEYAVAKSEHNNLEEEKKTVENELSLADHHLKAIECSKYFKEVKEENNNIEVLTKQIEEKENDSQQGKLLSSLKYSLRKIAEEQLPVLNERFENESTTRNDLYKKQDELEKLSNSAEKNRQTNKTRLDKVSGQLSYITDENDAKVKELGLNITRYLDGLYNDEELHKCLTARTNALSALLRNESNIEETIGKKESRKYEISETIPELNTSKAKAEDEIDSIRKEIDIYGQIEKEIEKITIEYSLDYSLRFTDIIKRTLKESKEINSSKKRKSEYKNYAYTIELLDKKE